MTDIMHNLLVDTVVVLNEIKFILLSQKPEK
jgi:hypothetical protein